MALLTWMEHAIPTDVYASHPISVITNRGEDYYVINKRFNNYFCEQLGIHSGSVEVVKNRCERHYHDCLVALRDEINELLGGE